MSLSPRGPGLLGALLPLVPKSRGSGVALSLEFEAGADSCWRWPALSLASVSSPGNQSISGGGVHALRCPRAAGCHGEALCAGSFPALHHTWGRADLWVWRGWSQLPSALRGELAGDSSRRTGCLSLAPSSLQQSSLSGHCVPGPVPAGHLGPGHVQEASLPDRGFPPLALSAGT